MTTVTDILVEMSGDRLALTNKVKAHPFDYKDLIGKMKSTPIDSMTDQINELLDKLAISPAQQGRFKGASISIYDFIIELKDLLKPTDPLNDLVVELNQANDLSSFAPWRRNVIIGVWSGVVILALFMAEGLSTIERLVSGAALIPIISMIYALLVTIQTLFPRFLTSAVLPVAAETDSFWKRFKQNFFTLSSNLLKVTTYILVLAAASTAPVIATLFVVVSIMLVYQELWALYHHELKKSLTADNTPSMQLNAEQLNARYQTEHIRRKREIMINIVVSAALTLLVVAWSFVPGGILVTIPVIACMGLVYLAKSKATQRNAQTAKEQLNDRFNRLELKYNDVIYENIPAPNSTQAILKSNIGSHNINPVANPIPAIVAESHKAPPFVSKVGDKAVQMRHDEALQAELALIKETRRKCYDEPNSASNPIDNKEAGT